MGVRGFPNRTETIAHTFLFLSMHSPDEKYRKLGMLLKLLKQRYPIRSMALFGSVTREDFGHDSDIDILVEFDGTIGSRFIDLALELESNLGRKVDLVSRKGIRDKYYQEIEQDLRYV